jgi:hypothetical protein
MSLPPRERLLDERFFSHRRRSTSIAGIVAAETSLVLFAYRYYVDHVVRWELLAVGGAFLVVKLGLMAWYHLTD